MASAETDCTIYTVKESNCDIDCTFKDNQGNVYNYKIDFMLPVARDSYVELFDDSIIVTIEYQGKVVMLSGSATTNNIDSYCTKYDTQKDIDVLIISYYSGDQEATIAGSASRESNYLTKISFEESDYAIVVPVGSSTGVESVENALMPICGSAGLHSLTEARNLQRATITITFSGAINVVSQ